MKIDTSKWKEFEIGDIFEEIYRGREILSNCAEEDFMPIVSSSSNNNGIVLNAKGMKLENKNAISIANNGSVGSCFFQEDNFYATTDVTVLRSKKLNKYNAIFIITVIKKDKYRFSYGRKWNINKMINHVIKLPSTPNGYPDFKYMEEYIKFLHCQPITTKVKKQKLSFDTSRWIEFKMEDLFEFKKGKRLTKEDMIEGSTNYIGAIDNNNGVRQQIKVEENKKNKSNCITVNYNGSVGEAFYQSEPFWASDDVNILYSKNWRMNKYNAIFLITAIKSNKYKFSYGRKWTLDKMKSSILKLPAKEDKTPDFYFMENYIKSLSYSDRI